MTVRTVTTAARPAVSGTFAAFAQELRKGLRRWNDRRVTAAALRDLSPAQLRDIGLEGADLDEVARRLVP